MLKLFFARALVLCIPVCCSSPPAVPQGGGVSVPEMICGRCNAEDSFTSPVSVMWPASPRGRQQPLHSQGVAWLSLPSSSRSARSSPDPRALAEPDR